MEYKIEISTETKHNVLWFEKTRHAKTIDEIIDYVNEMVTIFKKSAKVIVVIYDENKKNIAQFQYDYGWFVY